MLFDPFRVKREVLFGSKVGFLRKIDKFGGKTDPFLRVFGPFLGYFYPQKPGSEGGVRTPSQGGPGPLFAKTRPVLRVLRIDEKIVQIPP